MKSIITFNPSLIAAAAATLFLATGCRKELCYDHYLHAPACRVVMTPAYEQEWERDYGAEWLRNWDTEKFGYEYANLRPAAPDGLAVYVYDVTESGSTEISDEFHIAPDGEMIGISEGDHRVLVFNDDTRNIIIDGMASLPTARATTRARSRASYAQYHSDEQTVGPPDMLYGHYQPSLVTEKNSSWTPYEFTLRPLVYTYLVRYEVVQGREYIAQARGALAGMAENVYLTDGHTGDKAATVLFDCELTPYGAEAKVMSFGVPGFPDRYYDRSGFRAPGDGHRYALNLEMKLTSGQSYTLDFDITAQVDRQPRGGVITVSGIRLNGGEASGDGAFDVNVSDWGDYEEIPLN